MHLHANVADCKVGAPSYAPSYVLLVPLLVLVRVCKDGRRPCVASPPAMARSNIRVTHSSHQLYNDGFLDMWALMKMTELSLWRACCAQSNKTRCGNVGGLLHYLVEKDDPKRKGQARQQRRRDRHIPIRQGRKYFTSSKGRCRREG